MTSKQLLAKYAEGERDFSNINLASVNLDSTNLSGADFSNANFRFTELEGADLKGVNFSGTNFLYTNLQDADLTGANLSGAGLIGVNFLHANLDSVNLKNSWIRYSIGDGRKIKSLIVEHHICWTEDVMSIGDQQHSIQEWYNFSNISAMGEGAEEWWKVWKPRLVALGVFENVIK